MEKLTWKGCTELSTSILNSRPGDWTHTLDGQHVRVEKRVIVPSGQERMYYRGVDCAGSVSIAEWLIKAKPLEFIQMKLF